MSGTAPTTPAPAPAAPPPTQATGPRIPAAAPPGAAGMSIQQALASLRETRPEAQQAPAAPQAPEAPPPAPEPAQPPQEAPPGDAPPGEAPVEEQAPGEEAPPEQRFRVKVNGQDVEVTQAELIASYSREADYRHKTQQLAEVRRNTETREAQAAQALDHYANRLQVAEVTLREVLGPEPNWEHLAATEPSQYLIQERRWARLKGIEHELRAAMQQQGQVARHRLTEQVRSETAALMQERPELRDPAKFRAWAGEVRDFLGEMGFSPEEAGAIYDRRYLKVVDYALGRYRASKVPTPQPVAPAGSPQPATLAPGNGQAARPLAGAAASSQAARVARESFDAKPTMKTALAMLRANGAAPRRR